MKNHRRAWAEVSLSVLEKNIETIKIGLSDKTDIMAVVKADAYGHGVEKVVQKLESIGVKYFAVSNLDEAITVRKVSKDGEILILGYTSPDYADEISENNIIQCILSSEYASELEEKSSAPVRCHIKIDTGMGRIGLRYDNVQECCDEAEKIIKEHPGLSIEGVFTHFAVADSDDKDDIDYTKKQAEFIKGVYRGLSERGIVLPHVHFLNSAGAGYRYDSASTLARIGITMYGLYPNYSLPLPYEVSPVMSLKAVISEVKTVKKGGCVSYGRTFIAEEDTNIATVTIGYADGYSRLLSSKGEVIVRGKRCRITGRVCMDQIMIDVTGTDAKANDIVTLIGTDGDETITADELASWYGTIGYEVVCGISKRVPRIYIE